MTVTIHLSPETERKLLALAEATGKNVCTLIEEAVEEKLAPGPAAVRQHAAFLNSFTPQDEGLYEHAP